MECPDGHVAPSEERDACPLVLGTRPLRDGFQNIHRYLGVRKRLDANTPHIARAWVISGFANKIEREGQWVDRVIGAEP
jgi:hypothetical protein